MDIGVLKTFLEVNRTRHFGQAADNLFLTQSAVSARIRLLEQTLGVSLFTRSRNNIELTPAGKKLVNYADTIINTWNRARQEIALEETAVVPLSIGGVPSLWDILLQHWLNYLLKSDPNLAINAEVHGPENLVRKLIDRTLDVAFMFEALQIPELMIEEVGNIHLVLVSSKPGLTPKEAMKENYVLVDWGTSFSITHAQHFPDIPPPKLHAHLGRLAHEFISECGGSAYLAFSMVKDELDNGKLFKVEDAPVIKRMTYAAYTPTSEKRKIIEDAISTASKTRF
jgi:DNA-binding transcriptional LysR family regulator